MTIFSKLKFLVLPLFLGACVSLGEEAPMVQPKSAMPQGQPVQTPVGFSRFCIRSPEECKLPSKTAYLNIIEEARAESSSLVIPKADAGDEDYWQALSEVGPGDCEDFALTMRKILRGKLPGYSHNFLLTTAYTETGQYHAVLSIETEAGTIVCDIRYDRCMPWNYYAYTWHTREVAGAGYWQEVGPAKATPATATAATGRR